MGNKSSGEEENLAEEKVVATSPVENRGCTDIICCIVFVAYMIGMVIIAGIALKQGSPKRLLYPTDSDGKICGADIVGKPYLHFFDLTKCVTKGAGVNPLDYVKSSLSCPTQKVCVAKCNAVNKLGWKLPPKDMICTEGTKLPNSLTDAKKKRLIKEEKCAPYYVESKEVFYRCIPSVVKDAALDVMKMVDADQNPVNSTDINNGGLAAAFLLKANKFLGKVGDELKLTWKWLLLGFMLSMAISVVYIVLARWITLPLVIISAIGALAILGYSTYYSFAKYKKLVDSGTSKELVWSISMTTDDFAQSKNCWLVLGIALAVMFLILFLICIFLYSSVRLACALIEEGSRAVCSMLSTLIFPIIPWILQAVWLLWFVAILLFLMSNGTKQYEVSHNDTRYNLTAGDVCGPMTYNETYPERKSTCIFARYVQNVHLLRMQIYHLIGWLWGANYIIALAECSLAGAFASYYWAFNKPRDIPSFPIMVSMFRAAFYHSGSLALGASIITIVQLIRLTLEYIRRKLKETEDNKVADCLLKCCGCCFWCLEKCLRFINKNAYIMVAVTGKNFCVSGYKAVMILVKNIRGTLAINGVTGFILFLGRILITGGVGVASFFWFSRYNANLTQRLDYSIVPVLICTIGAYLVTTLFFSVYDMGIDTLFLCYCHDLDINNGADKPYFMTKSLQDVMSKHNKKAKKKDEPEKVPLPITTEA